MEIVVQAGAGALRRQTHPQVDGGGHEAAGQLREPGEVPLQRHEGAAVQGGVAVNLGGDLGVGDGTITGVGERGKPAYAGLPFWTQCRLKTLRHALLLPITLSD